MRTPPRKPLALLCCILLLCMLLTSCGGAEGSPEFGLVNYRRGHTFIEAEGALRWLEDGALVRADAESGAVLERITLSEDAMGFLNYRDGAFYYMSGYNAYIRRYEPETGTDEIITLGYEGSIFSYFIVDGEFYFTTERELRVYDADTDESRVVVEGINPFAVFCLPTAEQFFFLSPEDGCLYGAGYGDGALTQYTDTATENPSCDGDALYYSADGVYYRHDLASNEVTPLPESVNGCLWAAFDGGLYYSEYGTSTADTLGLYRYDIESGEVTQLAEGSVLFAEFTEDRALYYDHETGEKRLITLK